MKFNITVEYDIYDDYNSDQLDDLIAQELARKVVAECTDHYQNKADKISTQVKNEVVRQMVNTMYEKVDDDFIEKKINDKLRRELDGKTLDKLCERVSKRIEVDMITRIEEAAKKQVRGMFKNI